MSPGMMLEKDFDKLVTELKKMLGEGGISSQNVNPDDLIRSMEKYISNEPEWKEYLKPDSSRPYTRSLVDDCNDQANLLVLCWTPGRASMIHDHSGAHCIMKVLKGKLDETLYAWPDPDEKEESPLQVERKSVFNENEVTYIHDKIGLHKIGNPTTEMAVSLHLYTPRWAMKYGCLAFDEKTGKSHHVCLDLK